VSASALDEHGHGEADADQRARILLIEDDEGWAELVRELLARDHAFPAFSVTHVERFAAALAHMRTEEPACILLDLTLPDREGLAGLRDLQEAVPHVPIVVLSGLDDQAVAIDAVKLGAQDYLVKHHTDGHLLTRAVRYAIERKQAEATLAHQSLHDALTGLPNRALFLDRLDVMLARARREGGTTAVLFVDLDRFKTVNDSLGHATGDELLIEVARRLERAVRPSDTVARFGADEFLVLCDAVSEEPEVVSIAERIHAAFSDPFELAGVNLYFSASMGVALSRDGAGEAAELVRAADAAMDRSKERGSPIEFSSEGLRERALRRLRLEAELHEALERGQLRVLFQPEVQLGNGHLYGFEALVRWEHPTRGTIGPDEFIPVAEDAGMINRLGFFVLGEACRQLKQMENGTDPKGPIVSVNVSPRQLGHPGFAMGVADVLRREGVPPRRICLETAVTGELGRAGGVLRQLRDIGVTVSVDDFGTGYTSLQALDRWPVDMLKIDRSFIERLATDPRSRRIAWGIIGLGHAFGLSVVAEGVETADQLQELRALGCDVGQGYLFAPPQTGERARKIPLQGFEDRVQPDFYLRMLED
jgi:diguanylate cyclase (GGDEF)-like protein